MYAYNIHVYMYIMYFNSLEKKSFIIITISYKSLDVSKFIFIFINFINSNWYLRIYIYIHIKLSLYFFLLMLVIYVCTYNYILIYKCKYRYIQKVHQDSSLVARKASQVLIKNLPTLSHLLLDDCWVTPKRLANPQISTLSQKKSKEK